MNVGRGEQVETSSTNEYVVDRELSGILMVTPRRMGRAGAVWVCDRCCVGLWQLREGRQAHRDAPFRRVQGCLNRDSGLCGPACPVPWRGGDLGPLQVVME